MLTSILLLLSLWIEISTCFNETVTDFNITYYYQYYNTSKEWCFMSERKGILNSSVLVSCSRDGGYVDIISINHSISMDYTDWCTFGPKEHWGKYCGKNPEPNICRYGEDVLADCKTTCERPDQLCEQPIENLDTYRQGCNGQKNCRLTLQPKNLLEYCGDRVKDYTKSENYETLFWSKWATIHYICVRHEEENTDTSCPDSSDSNSQTVTSTYDKGEDASRQWYIIVPVILAVLVFLVIGLILICYRRKKKNSMSAISNRYKKQNSATIPLSEKDEESYHSTHAVGTPNTADKSIYHLEAGVPTSKIQTSHPKPKPRTTYTFQQLLQSQAQNESETEASHTPLLEQDTDYDDIDENTTNSAHDLYNMKQAAVPSSTSAFCVTKPRQTPPGLQSNNKEVDDEGMKPLKPDVSLLANATTGPVLKGKLPLKENNNNNRQDGFTMTENDVYEPTDASPTTSTHAVENEDVIRSQQGIIVEGNGNNEDYQDIDEVPPLPAVEQSTPLTIQGQGRNENNRESASVHTDATGTFQNNHNLQDGEAAASNSLHFRPSKNISFKPIKQKIKGNDAVAQHSEVPDSLANPVTEPEDEDYAFNTKSTTQGEIEPSTLDSFCVSSTEMVENVFYGDNTTGTVGYPSETMKGEDSNEECLNSEEGTSEERETSPQTLIEVGSEKDYAYVYGHFPLEGRQRST